VQPFLPFTDFEETAQSLETRRLGKRRVERLQIVRALTRPGYACRPEQLTTLAEFVIHRIGALVAPLAVLLSWLRLRRAGPDTSAAAGNAPQPQPVSRPASSP
jgi:hypothetical protein